MSQGLIQGSMREAPLPDIIQLVSGGSKTGCFHVAEDAKRCKIFLKDGRIIHAVSNNGEGLDAFYEVALWLDGNYRFEEGDQGVAPTINKPNASMLMELGRRVDEWRVISQKVGSIDLYPVSTLLPGDLPSGVNPRQAKLLPNLTGYYTVAELAEALQKTVINVAKDLYDLAMAGHVTFKGVRGGRRPEIELPNPPTPAAIPAPAVASGFPVAEEPPAAPALAPAAAPAPAVAPPVVNDPVRLAKLTAFTQRIAAAAKSVLPESHHGLVNDLLAKANQQIMAGEGPEAVKNLALSISRGAVEAGCDGELVKGLNAQLKALFGSK